MQITMFDVGNGEAVLIDTGTQTVLIDTGDVEHAFPHIDFLILTHPHADHIANAAKIIRSGVSAVYDNGQVKPTRHYINYLNACVETNTPHSRLKAGDRITLDNGAYIECLSPSAFFNAINDNSLVLKLVYGDFSMLFTGDIEREAETYLLDADVSAKILDAAHHGSKTSNTLDFIRAVNPEVVIISAGNKYGHPHKIPLENMLINGAQIFCTRFNGDISIYTDGISYDISCLSANWIDNYLGYHLNIRKVA